jgi:cytochrome c553
MRTNHRSAAAVAAISALAIASGTAGAQGTLAARSLAATCANCHGTDGRAVSGQAMPRLAGLGKDYLVAQMTAYRDGTRAGTVMPQLAKGYSAEQIDMLASFFAAQK